MKNLKNMQLDPVGEFYGTVIGEHQSGVYSISAYLKKAIVPDMLQLAVNDLMKRLPFLCGRLIKDKEGLYHELMTELPEITVDDDTYTAYYLEGKGHVVRVRYGEFHIKVEAIHSIIDGGGLVKFTRGLVSRYFELQGLKFDRGDIVSCFDNTTDEESANAYERFARPLESEQKHETISAYHHEGVKKGAMKILRHTFDVSEIKKFAKPYTITEYMMAHIFMALSKERGLQDNNDLITSLLPINCRNFFPCDTYRNFVANATILMPETKDFNDMLEQVHLQFKTLDKNYVQQVINILQGIHEQTKNMKMTEKEGVWKQFSDLEYESNTTTFSNLGLVKFPQEIEEEVEHLEFIVSLPESMPTSFSSITVGNKLTLAISYTLDCEGIFQRMLENICTGE